jgi:TetR/AcrR family transcriptional repressor of lmrAB and yxaGH operons
VDVARKADRSAVGSSRERILRAGVDRFQAHGYHGTGIAAILAEARAPKGCFYHHFPGGKEQLAVEAVEWLAGEVDDFLDRLNGANAEGADMVLGMAQYAAKGLARAHSMRGSLIAVLAAEAVPGSAAIGAALKRTVAGWTDKLSAGFERSGVANADSVAVRALALLEGAAVLARIAGRPEQTVEIVAASLKEVASGAVDSGV